MNRAHLTSENVSEVLDLACSTLEQGGLVIYPTETMYGVGVDATNKEAVTKMLAYKNRPAGKAISVLVANKEAAAEIVELNKNAEQLIKNFLPGPVTVVCKDKGRVDKRLPSELGTLGIRISSHRFPAALAAIFEKPITSTSANASGHARPYNIDELLIHLSPRQREAISLIVDAGELPKREPSTVIDTTQEVQTIVRAGEHLENLAPPVVSHSEAETQAYAEQLIRSLGHALPEKAVIFALEGELGMGKTQFAKGAAKALAIKEPITSPTFTLVKEYAGSWEEKTVHFIHMDCWRLQKVDPDELGLEEYIHPKYVIVIEWAGALLPYLREIKNKAVVKHIFFEESGKDERTLRLVTV